MKVAVTGAAGFISWHLRCALQADGRHQVVPLDRSVIADQGAFNAALRDCDAVVHLAGVNRGSDSEVADGNIRLADRLALALEDSKVRSIVHGNSIHAGTNSPFGRSKAIASDMLDAAAAKSGAAYTDVRLPNIFGEGGRPHYNSFVATFCYELEAGRQPEVKIDREVPLLHAQDAADQLITYLDLQGHTVQSPPGRTMTVTDVLGRLRDMTAYAYSGDFPALSDPFSVRLFTTFQSFCFPHRFPIDREIHSDPRGMLFESVRARGTDTLSFVSTTVPGAVRGQHYHRRKVERFLVIDGEAEIKLRRLCSDDEVTFRVSGRRPQAVDMPTLWAHSLKNIGDSTLTTVFWSNELLDPRHPDTHRFTVYPQEAGA